MAENQEHIEAQLCAYIDGELDAKGRAEIEKHLANNPQHQRLIAGLIESRAMMRALPRERAPEDIVESVQHSLERSVLLADSDDDAIAMPRRIVSGSHRMLAAAIVLLTIGLGLVIYYMLPSGRNSEFAVVAPPARHGGVDAAATRDADKVRDVETMSKAKGPAAKGVERDPFLPRGGAGGGLARGGAERSIQPQIADALSSSNSFTRLKKDDTDGQLVLVVNTDNPTVTNGQVTSYLVNNGIAWQQAGEPMPPPLDITRNQVADMSRLQQTKVQLQSLKEQGGGNFTTPSDGVQLGAGAGTTRPSGQQWYETPATSPVDLIYGFALGIKPANTETNRASNKIYANMTRRQAQELGSTLRTARAGQRAIFYDKATDELQKPAQTRELKMLAGDSAAKEYFQSTTAPANVPSAPAAVAVNGSTTAGTLAARPPAKYPAKGDGPGFVNKSGEISQKQVETSDRRIALGGSKDGLKQESATTVETETNDVAGQQRVVPLQNDSKLEVQQSLAGVQTPASQPSIDEPLNVVIVVNEDVAATEPTAGPTSQPDFKLP